MAYKYLWLDSNITSQSYSFKCEQVSASYQSGEYEQPITVQLSSITSNSIILYTLDGTFPVDSGIEYSVPIYITNSVQLNVVALRFGYWASTVSQYDYTISWSYNYYSNDFINNEQLYTSHSILITGSTDSQRY